MDKQESKIILGHEFIGKLCDRLGISPDNVAQIRINAVQGQTVTIEITRLADERLYDIIEESLRKANQ